MGEGVTMRERKDLTGMNFGKLKVIEYVGERKWRCVCDCGNTVDVRDYCLGKDTNSCGCIRFEDISGRKFGKLTAIERVGTGRNGGMWKCVCECGKTKICSINSLKNGNVKSCGCIKELVKPGEVYGRLTTIERIPTGKHSKWKCVCICGNETIVFQSALLRGTTQSCGCLANELASERSKTHGKSRTRIYGIWGNIKRRCTKENNPAYKDYGGRGIKMCKEWMNSFETFYEWAISNGYDKSLTIDRIDNNGDYSPENCRWVTQKVQANNTRSNHIITYNGKSMTMSQWAEYLGVNYGTMRDRRYRGWTDNELIEGKRKSK